jgi:hypothetical protein
VSIKVTIKLDSGKIRCYLDSNDVTIEALEAYLKTQGYKNVSTSVKVEAKARTELPISYSIPEYHIAYHKSGKNDNVTLMIESWFSITKHFTDTSLSIAIEDIIKPVLPPIDEDEELPKPNAHVSSLKPREYVTVFQQDEAALSDVTKLIQGLESVILNVRKEAGRDSSKIPSDVTPSFKKIDDASHKKGLAVFGFMPEPKSNPSAYSRPMQSSGPASNNLGLTSSTTVKL